MVVVIPFNNSNTSQPVENEFEVSLKLENYDFARNSKVM